jgi:hypothetical protein
MLLGESSEISGSNLIEALGVTSQYFGWRLLPSSIQKTGRGEKYQGWVLASSLGTLNTWMNEGLYFSGEKKHLTFLYNHRVI